MPSGKVHSIACLAVAGVSTSATFLLDGEWTRVVAIGAGALSGIICSPDLDVDAGHIGDTIIRKYFGLIVEKIIDVMLFPYRKIFKHRGFWSHFPVISTLVRLLYLSIWIGPIIYWLGVWQWHPWMAWWVGGLMLSDAVHGALDWADEFLFKGKL